MAAELDELMTISEVAEKLRTPVATVYQWNSKGTGPRYAKVGNRVLYRRRDVEEWFNTHFGDWGSGDVRRAA